MANEFKIKNGLQILDTQPVTGISDSSIFTNDSSSLATINAIKNHLEDNYVLDTSIGDYVRKDGDTMTGRLKVDASIHINGGIGSLSTGLVFGNDDSGIYEKFDDNIYVDCNGTEVCYFNEVGIISAATAGYNLANVSASLTVPVYSFSGDNDTGIGRSGVDKLSLITGGIEAMRLEASNITTDASLIIDGNVGIEISDPSAKLHINGGTGSLSTGLAFGNNGITGIYESADNQLSITAGFAEGIRITDTSVYVYHNLDISGNIRISGDASIVGDVIIDGSLINNSVIFNTNEIAQLDASVIRIDAELDTKTNLNLIFTDTSINYTLLETNNGAMIDASGTLTITLPDSVDLGYQIAIVNSGVGEITLDASNLMTTDASVKLIDQYAGASATHKGNGNWYAFGNLK